MGIDVGPMNPREHRYVRPLLYACGSVFTEEEIDAAVYMSRDALSGAYLLLRAIVGARFAGYCLAGPTPLTVSTWHLYWLCVHPHFQRQGVATALQSTLETRVSAAGGERIVVETGGRPEYDKARSFYRSAGYEECGYIANYYRVGDGCFFYCKVLK